MRRFWDRRAREDAFYFIDSRLGYRDPAAEQEFWRGGAEDLDGLLEALDMQIGPDDRVLEIGCGAGRLTRPLAQRARSVVALDVSPEMLALAARHNPGLGNVEWMLGDGVSLAGVADASVDLCVSWVVFQHIPDPAITLGYVREIGRVLRQGGVAGLQVSNDSEIHSMATPFRERVLALMGRGPRGRAHPAWRGSAVDLDDLRAAAGGGGMDVERVENEGTQYCLIRTRRR